MIKIISWTLIGILVGLMLSNLVPESPCPVLKCSTQECVCKEVAITEQVTLNQDDILVECLKILDNAEMLEMRLENDNNK